MHDPLLPKVLEPQGDVLDGLQFVQVALQGILSQKTTTFLSYSSRVPPYKYYITQISSFLEM
jgi:hypothetical protein